MSETDDGCDDRRRVVGRIDGNIGGGSVVERAQIHELDAGGRVDLVSLGRQERIQTVGLTRRGHLEHDLQPSVAIELLAGPELRIGVLLGGIQGIH